MYAISHAATALPLRRRFPEAGIWPILIAVQLVELLWVVFTFTGIEHYVVSGDRVRLSFLPYSHSIGTGLALSAAAFFLLRRRSAQLAAAVAIGITSHVVLDIIHHEPDIALLPVAAGPRLGLGLMNVPVADLVVELGYGIACWWIYRGGPGLLVGIVLLNLADWPLMAPRPGTGEQIAEHPFLLPTLILFQIVLAWVVVARLARTPRR